MAVPGETIYTGAPARCEDCGVELVAAVHQSGAGFYVGTFCDCGPYSRESGYFPTREEAVAILQAGPSDYGRNTEFASADVEGCARCSTEDTARFARHGHADYCDDCLEGENDAERTLRLLEVLADALAVPGTAQREREADHA